MKNIKKYISVMVAGLMMVSCVDTLILPDDKTVDEDFWKSKSDVQLMVNAAYQAMLNTNVISRLIVWGDLRSEEMVPVATVSGALQEDLSEINLGNTQTDNQFSEWGSLYSVISRSNLVLERAADVMQEDPSYTEGDYLADCSQMLSLRALCYFYLVRNFRDVPFITWSITDSSQDRNVPQSAPYDVLTSCLQDLEQAERNAISATAYNDWRRVGYFTRDAINALQADIHLWLGSVMHDGSHYEKAIAYCDKVIASKKEQHKARRGEIEEKDYWLSEGKNAFSELYISQNAEESVLELQFDGEANTNVGITQYYNHYRNASGAVPYLYASSIFKNGGDVYRSSSQNDWRGLMDTYNQSVTVGDFEGLEIRKYVSVTGTYSPNSTTSNPETKNSSYAATLDRNYIVYKLTDIMLMKAEALTSLASDVDDADRLHQAFDLVKVVNLRSKDLESDSLKWNTYRTSVADMEDLVLAERLRELAFEGKRWYDLLRYNFRHVQGVDYTSTLAAQNESGIAVVGTYQPMLDLMKRKLSGKGNAVAAKMGTEPKLYMPIPQGDINVCPVLSQNPGYNSNDNFNKNY